MLENQIASIVTSNLTYKKNFRGEIQGRMAISKGSMSRPSNSKTKINYVKDITASIDVVVLFQLLGLGILLALISSATAIISILRYEPLKILSNRT